MGARAEGLGVRHDVAMLLDAYADAFPGEERALAPLFEQLQRPAPDDRRTLPGHLTAASLVLHPARPELLLVRHRVLQRWLQPGGHLERGEIPLDAARREATEETGATALAWLDWHEDRAPTHAVPLDIDIHEIPARPERGEPVHLHLDFRYVFRLADESALSHQVEEVEELRWESLEALAARDLVPGLTRAARKLVALLRVGES
jgi:8-oxo-dGTP pyrophosphatase MutT (NUDIX family)